MTKPKYSADDWFFDIYETTEYLVTLTDEDQDVIHKLHRMGISITRTQAMTNADAMSMRLMDDLVRMQNATPAEKIVMIELLKSLD